MHITKGIFVLGFKGIFKVFEFLVKNKHGATYKRGVPTIPNKVYTIRMKKPNFQKFKLGGKRAVIIFEF